ncbi:MAG: septum formation initiator family protein [Rhodospirillaceae bacterium]
MANVIDIPRRARAALGPLLGAAAVAYFGFHVVQGDRGLIAWWHLRQELAQVQVEAQVVAAQRAELEHRVSLLRPESLDPDMLEERARLMVNMGRPNEQIVPLTDR